MVVGLGVGGGDGWEEERYIPAGAPQDCGEAPGAEEKKIHGLIGGER